MAPEMTSSIKTSILVFPCSGFMTFLMKPDSQAFNWLFQESWFTFGALVGWLFCGGCGWRRGWLFDGIVDCVVEGVGPVVWDGGSAVGVVAVRLAFSLFFQTLATGGGGKLVSVRAGAVAVSAGGECFRRNISANSLYFGQPRYVEM